MNQPFHFNHFGDYVQHLRSFGNRRALSERGLVRTYSYNYQQLYHHIQEIYAYLLDKGIKPGDRIMVVAPNCPQWGALFLAAQLVPATIVAVDAATPPETTARFARKAVPKLLFRGRYVADGSLSKQTIILDDLFELAKKHVAHRRPEPTPDATAVIIFTSGTTGDPRGVVLTQANLLANVSQVAGALKIQPSWRFLSTLPLSHLYELTAGFLVELSGGASIYYLPSIAPSAIGRALKDYHITSIVTVPLLLDLFMKQIESRAAAVGQKLLLQVLFAVAASWPFWLRRYLFLAVHQQLGGRLQFIATGGAPVDEAVAKKWELMGVKILQGYGLSETSPVLTLNTLKQRNLKSQGRTLPGVELTLAEDGEILAKGPNVFAGYLGDPKATAEAFTSDGFFRTGDIGQFDDQGWLYIKGRKKFIIVLPSGLKVFPDDVEPLLTKMLLFTEAAVLGITKDGYEQVGAVVISEASDQQIQAAINQLNRQVGEHQRITIWLRYDEAEFPRTRLLKVDHRQLQQWAQRRLAGETTTGSGTVKLGAIPEIVRLVSERPADKIKPSATLGQLGVDSLKRLAVVSLIEERVGISLAESSLHADTTVASLEQLVKQGSSYRESKRRHWPYTHVAHAIGLIFQQVLKPCLRFWVKYTVTGRDNFQNLPTPAIIIFNHVDNFDVPMVYSLLPWRIRKKVATAAGREYLQQHRFWPQVGRIVLGMFDFATKEPFLPSLTTMGELISHGWSIVISPEGEISANGRLQPFKKGTGMMAVEMQVPVIPIKTFGLAGTMPNGSYWPVKHSKMTVHIGQPVRFDPGTSYDEATKQLEQIMKDL